MQTSNSSYANLILATNLIVVLLLYQNNVRSRLSPTW